MSFERVIRNSCWAALIFALASASAWAARRPQYGGTLRVEWQGQVMSLDPAQQQATLADQIAQQRLLGMIADRLVMLDRFGQPQAALATAWQHDAAYKNWELQLRAGVNFQDATPLTPAVVVASLSAMNPGWHVTASSANSVAVGLDQPAPELLYILAEPRNAILIRKTFGAIVGTGPFRITNWEPGTEATLAANQDYWGGRPFLDSVDIVMGRSESDRMMDLELGKTDVADVAPENARADAARGADISASDPSELLALVFLRGTGAAKDARLRQALSLAIDRASLVNFVLQKEGEPAAALVPQWSSGYAFLFSAAQDPAAAHALVAQISPAAPLQLGYDSGDELEHMVAERIVVNAQAAGISMTAQPLGGPTAGKLPSVDARLVRLPMSSPAPDVALDGILSALGGLTELSHVGGAPQSSADSVADFYQRESTALASYEAIPLVHLPRVIAISSRMRDWMPARWGEWRLADCWLDGAAQ